MRVVVMALAGALAAALSGCASMETVAFLSAPEGAAVTTSNGLSCPATPCTIEVARKEAFVACFAKEGFREADVEVGIAMGDRGRAELVGTLLLGGIGGGIGYGVSGRGYDHQPNPVVAELAPLRPVSPLIERLRGRRAPTS